MNVKIYHVAILAGLVFGLALGCHSIGFDSGEEKTSSSLAKQKVRTADGLAMKDGIKIEYGEGYGETTDEALKEAMKDVLQKVVGVYVDSDFRMSNDKIIKDEIITHSNGFIDHYEKMEEDDDPNGRGKVVAIKAWVKMRDFVDRMKKIASSERINVDGVLVDVDLENDISAEALLRKEIENIDPANLLEVRLLKSRPEIVSVDEDIVTMRYIYVVRYSNEVYSKTFLPRIKAVLNQIAIKKDANERLRFSVVKADMYPRPMQLAGTPWSTGKELDECPQPAYIWGARLPWDWTPPSEGKTVAVVELIDNGGNMMSAFVFAIISKIERVTELINNGGADLIDNGGNMMLTRWRLSDRHMSVFRDGMKSLVSKQRGLRCVFSLFDERNNVVSSDSFPVGEAGFFDKFRYRQTIVSDFMPLIPIDINTLAGSMSFESKRHIGTLATSGVTKFFVDRFIGYVDVKVDKADVKRIKSAEIKLEATNKGEVE